MKRILSLFLSLVMVLSCGIGSISVNASVSADKTMIEKTKILVDTTSGTLTSVNSGSYATQKSPAVNGVKQPGVMAALSREQIDGSWVYDNSFTVNSADFDESVFEFNMKKKVAYMQVQCNWSTGASFGAQSVPDNSKIRFSGRVYNENEGIPSWEIKGYATVSLENNLKSNTWYKFDSVLDLTKSSNDFTVTYTEELSVASSAEGATPHTVSKTAHTGLTSFNYYRVRSGVSVGNSAFYDDLKLEYTEPPYEKAEIKSVGTNNVVTDGQNIVPVTLSNEIPEITKEHITVTNKETNQTIDASSIEITSDGTNPVVKATLTSNLASWSEYTVTVDALAFGEGSVQRTGDAEPTAVTDISKDFATTKPPFATKGFEYTVSGDELTAKGLVANTTGTPKDIKMIFSAFDSQGVQGAIVPTNYDDFNNASGEEIEATTTIDDSEKYNFFIIDNWTDKTPLLGVSAMVDSAGNIVPETAVSGGALSGTEAAISADELNHDTLKLSVRVDTKENAVADGILLVYKKGEVLSDTSLPLYAKSVSTAADGTLSELIPLSESLDYGEYTVEFASASLTANLTDNFKHYTPAELLAARKAEILADAKSATTSAGLKEVILGLNADDETVNSNFDIVGSDADMTNYEEAYDRDNIFTRMLSSVAALSDYDALISLFEEASADQIQYEIDNPTIMIESGIITVADTRNTVTYAGTTGTYTGTQALMTDSVKNHWFYISNNGTAKQKVYNITNDTSFGGSVVKLTAITPAYFEMFFGGNIPGGSNMTHNSLKGQSGAIEGRIRFTEEVTPYFKLNPDGGNGGNLSIGESLKADTWYNFKWEVVTGSYVKVTFTESGSDVPQVVSKKWNYTSDTFTYFRFYPTVAADESVYFDDIIVRYELIPYEKAKITSVGTNGVVDGYQNTISFELSNKIPGITKDHITVTNKETNETIAADSITVTGDTTQTVNVTLASNLAGWAEYTLTIDPLAFGEGNLQRTGRQELAEITALSGNFTTTKAPLASKSFVFTSEDGCLKAKGLVANTTGTPKDMTFVFAGFDADGRFVSVVPTVHTGFNNPDGDYLEASVSTTGASRFNFFVIDDWSNRTPLLGANYNVNAKGSPVSSVATSSGEAAGTSPAITLGDFDYTNIKIAYELDTKEGKTTDGIIFVYKNGEVLSSANLPDYAKAVTTAANGTLSGEIILPSSLAYGAYTVEFVSDKLSDSVTNTFRYYSPDEILANKRAEIFADAKAASSAESLQEALTGVNSAGEKVNENADVFGKDADMTAYNKNLDKLKVFTKLLPSVQGISSYDALVSLFESCASAQRTEEIAAQKLQMINDVKSAKTASGLMQIILGVDSKENVVNTNFELISGDADMSVYNSLKNKSAVFSHMISSVNSVEDYNSIIELFEKAARTQKSKESTSAPTSSNNSSYGGSSTAIKETVKTPVVSQVPVGDTQSSSSAIFKDMSGHWASSYVEALYKRGIMNGYPDGSFRGGNSITRAELAKTIVEAFGIATGGTNSFSDVSDTSWYAAYVAGAAGAGVITGMDDGTFAPDREVSRQDAVLMLYRAMSIGRKLPIGYTFFNDDLEISDYASGAIRTLGELGIVSGNESKQFMPLNSISRAEVATIICRALDYIESH